MAGIAAERSDGVCRRARGASDASDDPENLGVVEQMLPCETCEGPEDPTTGPTGGGTPIPTPCGGASYPNGPSSPKYPSNLSQRFRNAHDEWRAYADSQRVGRGRRG